MPSTKPCRARWPPRARSLLAWCRARPPSAPASWRRATGCGLRYKAPLPSPLERRMPDIRPLAERDLPAARLIFQTAFGTFLGAPDLATFWADRDLVYGRF